MRAIPVRLPYSYDSVTRFVLAGDFHYGAAQCDVNLIRRFVNTYKDAPNTHIFLMGDECDAITRHDKRFDSMSLAEGYRGQRNFVDMIVDDYCELMKPLAGKIIAGVDSNHNASHRKATDSDLHYRISRALGFERLGYGGWVTVLWDWHKHKGGSSGNRTRKTIFHLTHGKPTCSNTPGGSLNVLNNDAQFFASDVMAHGHTHRLSAGYARTIFEPNTKGDDYAARKQHLVQTGSFLKSYSRDEFSPYSEVKRYAPIDLGWAVVDVSWIGKEPCVRTSVVNF